MAENAYMAEQSLSGLPTQALHSTDGNADTLRENGCLRVGEETKSYLLLPQIKLEDISSFKSNSSVFVSEKKL